MQNSPDHSDDHDYRVFVCTSCGNTHTAPLYCGDRFCDTCGKFRRFTARARADYILTHFTKIPGFFWRHITLTIPNVSDPSQGVQHLFKSFRKLRQRRWWKHHAKSGLFTFEVTGSKGNWHVHVHALVYSRWIPFPFLKRQWKECSRTGDHVYITQPTFTILLRHLTKYINDPGGDDVRVAWKESKYLRGRRLYQTFGSIPKVPAEIGRPARPCQKCGAQGSWLPMEVVVIQMRRAFGKDYKPSSYQEFLPAIAS